MAVGNALAKSLLNNYYVHGQSFIFYTTSFKVFSYLIKENIFSINSFCCKIFQYSFSTNSMFCTQLLPKLKANWN